MVELLLVKFSYDTHNMMSCTCIDRS